MRNDPTVQLEGRAVRSCLLAIGLMACSGSATTMPTDAPANQSPRIVSSPPTTADHNREYRYEVRTDDPDGDSVIVSAVTPSWLAFDADSVLLTGVAGWDNLGPVSVTVRATDGAATAIQTFTLTVEVGEIDCETTFGDPADSPYILPFPSGRTYTLFQGYCPTNPNWGHYNWFAYDFDLAVGDTVVAARAGVVTVAIEQYFDGTRVPGEENLIYILHDDGSRGAYVHLTHNGALVEVGDVVAQGDPIGLAGDTGNSSGPHLHFHVFREGGFTRHYTLPVNFANADGPVNARNGPVQGAAYTSLP